MRKPFLENFFSSNWLFCSISWKKLRIFFENSSNCSFGSCIAARRSVMSNSVSFWDLLKHRWLTFFKDFFDILGNRENPTSRSVTTCQTVKEKNRFNYLFRLSGENKNEISLITPKHALAQFMLMKHESSFKNTNHDVRSFLVPICKCKIFAIQVQKMFKRYGCYIEKKLGFQEPIRFW